MTITELRALLDKATPGPWQHRDRGHGSVVQPCELWVGDCSSLPRNQHRHDAAIIVATINALPALLDVAEAAVAVIDNDLAHKPEYGPDLTDLAAAIAKLKEAP